MSGRMTCPLCNGSGKAMSCTAVYPDGTYDLANPNPVTCMVCEGDGFVEPGDEAEMTALYVEAASEVDALKTEAATLAQLARDLYDGEEITPEAALRRLHQECMTATARVSALEEEVKLVRRDAVFLKNITTDEPRLAEIRARRDGSYEGETVRDLLRDTSWLIMAVDRFKAELEEQRLVVRAHLWDWRGRINPNWHPHNRMWCRTFPDGRTGQVGALHWDEEHHTVTWTMGVLGSVTEGRRPALTGGTSDDLREGMRAVEAAWAATASPDRPSPSGGV